MTHGIRDFVAGLAGRFGESDRLRALVLGDPSADVCRRLASDGHMVECCPDLQQSKNAQHVHVEAMTLGDLMSTESRWDLVVATEGFRRMQEVHHKEFLVGFFDQLADRCSVLLVEAPRRSLAPDLHDLGPYIIDEVLGRFLFVTEWDVGNDAEEPLPRPLLVASNHHLFIDGTFVDRDDLVLLAGDPMVEKKSVRTLARNDRVIKIELASEGYFDRCDASNEARFLDTASTSTKKELDLPRVLETRIGRAVNLVVRERMSGRALLPGECSVVRDLLVHSVDTMCRWASAGLCHNDLRPWNLLWNGSSIRFVDFANCSPVDNDVQGLPQVVAFAGTMAALTSGSVPWGDDFLPAIEALATESRLEMHFPLVELVGDGVGQSPWFALPQARDRLVRSLLDAAEHDPAGLMFRLVEDVMAVHVGRSPSGLRRPIVIGSETQHFEGTKLLTGIQRVVHDTHVGLVDRLAPQGIDVVPVHLRQAPRESAYLSQPYLADDPVLSRSVRHADDVDAFVLLDMNPEADMSGLFRSIRNRKRPVVAMVYDIIPLKLKDLFTSDNVSAFRLYLQQILHLADHIVVTSEQVRNDVLNLGWRTKAEFHVIPLGSTFSTRPPVSPIDDRLSILYVSTIEPRKGHRELLEAFDILRRQNIDVDLTLIGRAGWGDGNLFDTIRYHPEHGARLKWLQAPSDAVLTTEARRCSIGVFPAREEGFGLFIEEGLALGLKMVASDIPVFREREQTNLTFTERSPAALADAILAAHRAPWRSPERPIRLMSDFVGDLAALLEDVVGVSERGADSR